MFSTARFELFADVQILLLGLLHEQEVGDHHIQHFFLQQGKLLLILLPLESGPQLLDRGVVLPLVVGQGDDVVVDDGHDLLDDLAGGQGQNGREPDKRE